jgi:hypothetical protein
MGQKDFSRTEQLIIEWNNIMKTYNYGRFPKNYAYHYGNIASLEDCEIKTLKDMGISNVYYWYASGDYEGSGQMLCKKGNFWYLHDMNHCSCYGGVEHLDLSPNRAYSSLKELKLKCTDELFRQIEPLFNKAKKDKHK